MVKTAVILAGGYGTRLRTVINDVPKPMAPVNGIPFLTYQLNFLHHFGFQNIVFSTGYLAEKIGSYYQGRFRDMTLRYANETSPLGTGGAIRLALEQVDESTCLVLNGDSFFDVDLRRFNDLYIAAKGLHAIALRRVPDAARYGTIVTDNGRIVSFSEKSAPGDGIINGGIYLLEKQNFMADTNPGVNFSVERDFFEKQLNNIPIMGFEFNGYFIDIGIPADYEKAQHDFKGFKY